MTLRSSFGVNRERNTGSIYVRSSTLDTSDPDRKVSAIEEAGRCILDPIGVVLNVLVR